MMSILASAIPLHCLHSDVREEEHLPGLAVWLHAVTLCYGHTALAKISSMQVELKPYSTCLTWQQVDGLYS